MSRKPTDLPADSLGSLDEQGNRLFIYPAAVKGLWHRRRMVLQAILLLIFIGLPWLRIDHAPAVLLNLPERKFALFGLTFWAHDAPMIFFVLASAALGLTLATAVWGRIWCGWACPQTVFIEQVYRRIEILIEGSHLKRRQLNEGPWSAEKIGKKILKHAAFGAVSWFIGNTFLAYFVGTEQLIQMIQTPPSHNWTSFIVMSFVTCLVWFDFGWFREQFCIIMCPYGRFQSAMMDRHSLALIYDHRRGEPRKGEPLPEGSKAGDCINCFKCVAVCPTAIDIRRGIQLECIACTACADACDEVMEKIKKPKGLIRYGAEVELEGEVRKPWRLRVKLNFAILSIILIGFGIFLSRRQDIPITIIRGIDAPYKTVTLNNGQPGIANHFQIVMQNHRFEEVRISVELAQPMQDISVINPLGVFTVGPGRTERQHIFVEFPKDLTAKAGNFELPIVFKIESKSETSSRDNHFHLVGPLAQ